MNAGIAFVYSSMVSSSRVVIRDTYVMVMEVLLQSKMKRLLMT